MERADGGDPVVSDVEIDDIDGRAAFIVGGGVDGGDDAHGVALGDILGRERRTGQPARIELGIVQDQTDVVVGEVDLPGLGDVGVVDRHAQPLDPGGRQHDPGRQAAGLFRLHIGRAAVLERDIGLGADLVATHGVRETERALGVGLIVKHVRGDLERTRRQVAGGVAGANHHAIEGAEPETQGFRRGLRPRMDRDGDRALELIVIAGRGDAEAIDATGQLHLQSPERPERRVLGHERRAKLAIGRAGGLGERIAACDVEPRDA